MGLWVLGKGYFSTATKEKVLKRRRKRVTPSKKLATMKLEYEKLLYIVKFKLFVKSLIT